MDGMGVQCTIRVVAHVLNDLFRRKVYGSEVGMQMNFRSCARRKVKFSLLLDSRQVGQDTQ